MNRKSAKAPGIKKEKTETEAVDDAVAAGKSPFPIVGVGASAGGLEAFTQLLKSLPTDAGLGYVLVQHLDPEHESVLAHILGRVTSMPVTEIIDGEPVKPDHVYVIPRDTSLTISRGALHLEPRERMRTPHRPIDIFFQSLASSEGERAIGIVLSGTGTDGTIGLEAIKAEGGITFVQDDSAKHPSMPRSAIAAGVVDLTLPPAEIAAELGRIAKHPFSSKRPATASITGPDVEERDRAEATAHQEDDSALPSGGLPEGTQAPAGREPGQRGPGKRGDDQGYKKIMVLLRNHSGVDFSLYKSTTIQRRITRRMILTRHENTNDYAAFLKDSSKELDTLYSDVLISVTSFFRNPEVFERLQSDILPQLLQQRTEEPVRCWVLGCSTGQEAYSMAINFLEAAEKAPQARPLQVFATDLNERLLEKARSGLYAKSLAEEISPERLRRFFTEESGGFRVAKMLRDMVIFARQNLISDPPFSRMDLISCRNLLIYLDPASQKRAIPTFHYALRSGGYLILGASESIGTDTDLFEVVDKKHKIYSKKPGARRHLPLTIGDRHVPKSVPTSLPPSRSKPNVADPGRSELAAQRHADRISITRFAPPGVLVDENLQILQFRGPTGRYLQTAEGKATFDILKMAREGLAMPLRSALSEAKKSGKTVRRSGIRVQAGNGTSRPISVEIIPLKSLTERSWLILFHDGEQQADASAEGTGAVPAPPTGTISEERARISELEAELAETHEYLQAIQEQYEASSEELQATTEEVQSANEELQSINEELETSKEELESGNEELSTVNEEMGYRNEELGRLNSDLVNFNSSIKTAILLIGRDLRIRRFSPQAEPLLDLALTDLGRPIGHVRHHLTREIAQRDGGAGTTSEQADLEKISSDVISSVQPQELEVKYRDSHWYSLRVRPYMTIDNRVDGAVLVLMDINDLKVAEMAAQAARIFADNIVETVPVALMVLDMELRVQRVNLAFYRKFAVSENDTVGRFIYDLGNRQWNIPRLRELLEKVLPSESSVDNFEVDHHFESIGRRIMIVSARQMHDPEGRSRLILLALDDVTESRQFEQALTESERRFRFAMDAAPQKIFTASPDGAVVYLNPIWSEFTGLPFEEIKAAGWTRLIHPEEVAANVRDWQHSIETGEPFLSEHRYLRGDGVYRWHLSRAVALKDDEGKVLMWVGSNTDVDDIKRADDENRERLEDEVRKRTAELLAINEQLQGFTYSVAHDLRQQIRGMNSNASILLSDASDVLDGDSQRTLARLVDSSRKLGRLVDDLLTYARLGKKEPIKLPIDLSALAEEVATFLVERGTGRAEVQFKIEPNLSALGDLSMIRIVLENLLDNACKYSAQTENSVIEVGRRGDAFFVKDNGIGFDMEFVHKLFQPFERLHGDEKMYAGTGIGLANVRRIVEKHGGSVWATGQPGNGAEFYFKLE